jgi:hypothetical protein
LRISPSNVYSFYYHGSGGGGTTFAKFGEAVQSPATNEGNPQPQPTFSSAATSAAAVGEERAANDADATVWGSVLVYVMLILPFGPIRLVNDVYSFSFIFFLSISLAFSWIGLRCLVSGVF